MHGILELINGIPQVEPQEPDVQGAVSYFLISNYVTSTFT